MVLQYYHNDGCSKSRAALKLLQQAGFEPVCVRYLEHPPTAANIVALAGKLNMSVHDMVRNNEAAYSAWAHLAVDDDQAWAQAIHAEPCLLQRPILETDHAAVVCRPPELAVTWLVEQGHEHR